MSTNKAFFLFLAASLAALASCSPAETATPTSAAITSPSGDSSGTSAGAPIATPIPTFGPSADKPKNIVVDGMPDDWVGSAMVIEDSAQDIPNPDYMNITKLSMVSIERSLYIMMEVAVPHTIFSGIEFHLNDLRSVSMGKHLLLFWRPGTDFFEVTDITDMAHPVNLGITHYSTIAIDQVLEAKIDNRDIEKPENYALTSIRLKTGNVCKPGPENYGDDVRVSDVYNVPIGEVYSGGEAEDTSGPSAPPSETQISVDGLGDDWSGRELVFQCPAGDVDEGFIDLTGGYAFVNQNALYFMIQAVDPKARVDVFYISVSSGGKEVGFVWRPSDPTAGLPQYSSFALGDVFEGRIDLRDLNLPEGDYLLTIYAYYYQGEDRVLIDIWMGGKVPAVNEIDK